MAVTKKTINDYNYYDRGYSTGSQTSIFVGPIWVDEALSINISSSSNDVPIYPYSSEYFNRLLLGRYIVTGTFVIPFIKPNYLLSIIQQASSTQLSQAELKAMISERTNIFTQTVAAKIENKNADITAAETNAANYARRVSREIEVVSKGFDLTIVQGNIYGETSSIEIYQNVKITQVQKGILNDDETVVEIYSFTAQRMPDKAKPVEQETPNATRYILKDDVVAAAKAIVKDIVHEAFAYPEIKILNPTRRPGLLYSTDKVGITGPLYESSRSFGRTASFKEIIYSYKYPLSFNLLAPITPIPDDDTNAYSSNASVEASRKYRYKLPIYRKSGDSAKAVIEGNADPIVTNISNAQGNIVSLDRTISAKYICAAGQIAPVPKTVPVKGGTILLKRTKATNAEVGSYVPPVFVSNDKFTCADTDLDGLRYGVMWNSLIGCRSSGQSDSATPGKDDKCIRKMGRPLLSVAYYAKSDIEVTDDGWCYTISSPVYLDYIDTNISNMGEGKSQKPLLVSDWKDKVFTMTGTTASQKIVVKQPDDTSITAMDGGKWNTKDSTLGPVIATYYDRIKLGEPYNSIEVENPYIWSFLDFLDVAHDDILQFLSKFHYKFFEITIPLVGKCGVDFTKSFNIQPYVFIRKDATVADKVFTDDMVHSTDVMKVLPAIASKYKSNGGEEDSCKIDFWYDWTVTSVGGDLEGQSVTIHGLYYAHKKEDDGGKNKVVDVAFVATLLPMFDHTKSDSEKDNAAASAGKPELITDINQNGGQYTELYSFVRCDVPSYYSVPFYHTDQVNAIDVLKGSLIPATPWSRTPVWGHMGFSSEIDYQYGLYKKLLTKFIPHAASVLPDVALNTDKTFDITKDIPCLSTIIRNTLSPLAGFVRGFGFALSPKGIYNALCDIGFSGEDLSTVNVFKKTAALSDTDGSNTSPICFGTAFRVYGLEKTIIREIRKIILDEANLAGYTISDDPLNNLSSTDITDATPIYIETQVVTPAQDVVRYGFTDEGYKSLTGNPTSSTTETSTKTLKGYSF